MSAFDNIVEAAKVHPMAVHAYPTGGGKFVVHAVGPKVTHVKKGDKVSSSDLDDLSDAGHKVKEVKKPVSEGWMVIGAPGGKSPFTAFGDKKADSITLGDDSKNRKKDKEAPSSKTGKVINDRLTTKEEVEQVDEKLTPEAKGLVKRAAGYKPKLSQVKTIVSIAKSNKKNVVSGTK